VLAGTILNLRHAQSAPILPVRVIFDFKSCQAPPFGVGWSPSVGGPVLLTNFFLRKEVTV
jgi:hypothetical protein